MFVVVKLKNISIAAFATARDIMKKESLVKFL